MKRSAFLFLKFLLCFTAPAWGMEPFEEKDHSPGKQDIKGHKSPIWNIEKTQIIEVTEPKTQSSPLLTKDIEQKTLEYLQSFDLSQQEIDSMWEDFKKFIDLKGEPSPFSLASLDPYYIAFGLWKAHQAMSLQHQASQTSLSLKFLRSCLLSKGASNIYKEGNKTTFKKISLEEAHLLKSLIQSNPYFKNLELFNAGITDAHLSIIGIIPHLQELSLENASEEKDALGNNTLTENGLKMLAAYPKLQKLNMAKNKISSQGAGILAKSQTLKHLNLYKNSIGNEGAEYFSHNTVLDHLDLRENGIEDKGAIALGTNNKTLTDLRLRYNKITNVGAEAFLKSHHLTHLELGRNQISEDRVLFLENLMPSNGYLNKLHDYKVLPQSDLPPQKERVRILSIDGGGIRGLLPGVVLKYVEDGLTQKLGSQFYFAQHLDLVAGTSTGGIISLGLVTPGERGHPKYTIQTLVDLYTTKGHEIFPAPWFGLPGLFTSTYSPEALEKYLGIYFEETFLSESMCPTLITSFDIKSNKAHTFDSYKAKKKDPKNFLIRLAGRATSAAPTYFPVAKIKNKIGEEFELVDGGIYANNPTLLAIKRAQQLYPQAKEYMVYSFGTGQPPKSNLSYLGNKGLFNWGLNVADVLMDNAAEYTEEMIKKQSKEDPRIKYVRIQPHIQTSEKGMDNVDPDNIQNLLRAAQATIETNKVHLDEITEDFYRDFHTQGKK